MQVLNPKAIESFTTLMEYESHILIKSLYEQGKGGELPISPAHYTFHAWGSSFCKLDAVLHLDEVIS